jgi:hypothetical protein
VIAICQMDESRWTRFLNVVLSIARLLARFRTGSPGRGGAAHARLLP